MTAKVLLRAKYDFAAADTEELPLKAGDVVSLLFKDESGWAKGMKSTGEKGWFPIEYVDLANDLSIDDFVVEENPAAKIPDSERPRYNIVSEIMQTEKTYLKNITKIVKSFMVPLKDGAIIETKSIPKIFANIEDIHNLNTKLFLELEGRIAKWNETALIGDVFASAFEDFGAYEEYLKSHHAAILTDNNLREQKKNFALWLQTMKDQREPEGLDLLAYLIMPVQRILRYKLLLEDLLKNTKSEHPDYTNIQNALKKIGDLAVSVNESIKEEENYQSLLRIQKGFMGNVKNIVIEGRTFVREGPVMKVCRKTDKPRWFFLFSDVLVYASAAVGSLSRKSVNAPRQSVVMSGTMGKRLVQEEASQKFLYHRMLPLKTTKVKALEDTLSLKNAFQIITTEEKSFVVYTDTPQEKDAWVKDLTKFSSAEELADSAPVWIPDREAKTCMSCAKAFNMVNRRHHCRYCGKVVCGACSPQSIKIPSLSQKPVRVCKVCYEDFKKGELKDVKSWEGSRESYGTDIDSRSSSARSSMIVMNGLDLENESLDNEDMTSPKRQSLSRTNSSAKNIQASSRSVSTTNLKAEVQEANMHLVQSTSAESAVSPPATPSNSTSPTATTPITSPTGTPSKVPPKPTNPKPPIKPKPSTLTESDLIKKRIEFLTKTLEDETIARAAMEKNLNLEVTELRRENAQLREELEDIKQRILPILEKAALTQ